VTRTIYALLVGINDYLGGVNGLNGCVNDVKRMAEFLQLRTAGGEFSFKPLILTSGDPENTAEAKPTRQAVIDGFRNHLSQAGPDDVALFYYSGHGSQEKAPLQFWHLEPDHLDETIVCYDSRTDGGWDLADKELAVLIAETAQQGAHVLVILDSCHSGSGTRAAEDIGIRLAPRDTRDRPLDSFLPGVAACAASSGAVDPAKGSPDAVAGEWFTLPHGRHVVISACRAEESAREKMMEDGYNHGVLSYYLLDTVQQVGPNLSYRDVFSRAATLVQNTVTDQNPLIAATESDDLKRPFLGGAILPQRPYFTLKHRKGQGWILEAGTIHGIAQPAGDETTHLSVFGLDTPLNIGETLAGEVGRARVTKVRATESVVELTLDDGSEPDRKQVYKAVVIATPLVPILVFLAGDDQAALDALRQKLASSLIVRETPKQSGAAIVVSANKRDDRYWMRRAGDLSPLSIAVLDKGKTSAAVAAAARVEHMAQWMQVLNLENKQSQLPADAVTMELYQYDEATGKSHPFADDRQMRLTCETKGDEAGYATFQIRLVNRWKRDLYCMLVNLTEDFAVSTAQAFFGGGTWLKPGEEAWATQKSGEKYVYSWVPEEFRRMGVYQVRDVIKLIVSTDSSDATLLKQDGLEAVLNPKTRGLETSRAAAPPSTLHRLMQRVQMRAAGDRPPTDRLSDWRTAQVSLVTVDVSGGVALSQQAGKLAELADGVTIEGHSALRARAKLSTLHEGARDVGNLALPSVFRSHPEMGAPFDFRPSRGGDAGSSVIVLSDVKQPEAVTPEAPLIIHTNAPLAANETLLPMGYDPASGLFLPLGTAQRTTTGLRIRIDRLPGPTSDSRDLKGSIKLFFQKVIGEKLGLDPGTTRLAAATVNEQGQVVYDADPVAVAAKVKAAKRILLYIHGFTGDTRGMVASSRGLPYPVPKPPPALADRYDLILAFDYENINTAVERTAIKLKEHLAAVGLVAGHKKTLHIVAHSLGCVVTRWFIEREGGRKIVAKAALVGPPNKGSPWARVEDLAIVGLGAAINGLAAVIWPPAAIPALVGTLSSLVAGVETVDTTLDQLKPGSDFYVTLNASDDPRVPYVVIAGNTAKMHTTAETAQAEQALLQRLVNRLTSQDTRKAIADLVFFGRPNDLVIGVESMRALPPGRKPAAKVDEIACDHVSYFSTEVGLRAVAQALA
jgi:triacylglycerol esterase/lipase EstA (alpha/beta hydrolase family)